MTGSYTQEQGEKLTYKLLYKLALSDQSGKKEENIGKLREQHERISDDQRDRPKKGFSWPALSAIAACCLVLCAVAVGFLQYRIDTQLKDASYERDKGELRLFVNFGKVTDEFMKTKNEKKALDNVRENIHLIKVSKSGSFLILKEPNKPIWSTILTEYGGIRAAWRYMGSVGANEEDELLGEVTWQQSTIQGYFIDFVKDPKEFGSNNMEQVELKLKEIKEEPNQNGKPKYKCTLYEKRGVQFKLEPVGNGQHIDNLLDGHKWIRFSINYKKKKNSQNSEANLDRGNK